MYRQGDVLLVPIDPPALGKPLPRQAGRIVLALGEATGHAHAVEEPAAELFQQGADRILSVGEGGATLRHEEHAAIPLPPGAYRVVLQREYSPEGIRDVAD